MLIFNQGNTAQRFVVTLSEKAELVDPYFLFEFEHITSKDKVYKFINSTDDLSTAPARYNEFEIDVDDLFGGYPTGQWLYRVYETDELQDEPISTTGLDEVENGKMNLVKSESFEFKKYNGDTSYKAYAG